ncbi:MAG: LCP family protein [Eggerthellaceae bacterium]|nr:LCP family protein [Eggerthellaceae bacterium]
MGDRYDDRYDSYDDGYDSRSNGRYSSSRSDRSGYRSSNSRSGSSSSQGSYGANSNRRLSQSADARYVGSQNVFSDFYPEDDNIDFYRRSSYGSGASGASRSASRNSSRSSSRRSSYADEYSEPYSANATRNRSSRRVSHTSTTPRTTAERGSERRRYSDSLESQGTRRYSANTASSSRRSEPVPRNAAIDDDEQYYDEVEYAPKKSNRKRNIIIAVVVVIAVILIGAGAAFAYVNSISSNLHEGVDEDLTNALVPTNMADEPFYVLLLGTDTSEWRVENESDYDTTRSDSMMLARIDPVKKKVALISIDRDTMVEIEGYGTQKINAAYEIGGAAGAVKAVSNMTGLDISHYASVDFDGFAAIVDALGGVEVDVPMAVDDPEAGGTVEAGLQTLNGEQALILCRSRHAYDDMNTVGGYVRDGYQRMILGAIAKKLLSSDILTIANTVTDMSRYVTTDMNISDIIGLAQIMQGLDPDTDIYTAREPTYSLYIDSTWYEVLDEDEWAKMIDRMDRGLSPSDTVEVDPATGVLLSTTGSKSEASAAAQTVSVEEGARAVNTRDPEAEEYWEDDSDDSEYEE